MTMPVTDPNVDALSVECPICVMPPGALCIDLRANPAKGRPQITTVHRERFRLANPNSTECDICKIKTGNLPRHRVACARKHGKSTGTPIKAMDNVVMRAGSFAAAEAVVPVDGQFKNGVTDLDVASLLAYLDQGGVVVPRQRLDRWTAAAKRGAVLPSGSRRNLSTVVNETIRLGLTTVATERTGQHTYRTFLAPAMVHMRSRFNRALPACTRPAASFKRYRLMDDRMDLVDCLACLDIATI